MCLFYFPKNAVSPVFQPTNPIDHPVVNWGMKWIAVMVATAGISGLIVMGKVHRQAQMPESVPGSYAPVAVLELFTSEGCSSCPPADRLLPQLAKEDAMVYALSFHVDYWDRYGWKDPFSSSAYSDRQRQYGQQLNLETVYTPQLVVNGKWELVGSNRVAADAAIKKALNEKATVALKIAAVKKINDRLSFTVEASGEYTGTTLAAALVQEQASMDVKAGENRGATLVHTQIVRVFDKKKTGPANNFEMTIPADLGKWQLVVYVQNSSLAVAGATAYIPN